MGKAFKRVELKKDLSVHGLGKAYELVGIISPIYCRQHC